MVFVEKAATVLPDAATIMQNTGTKANTKSAQTDMAVQARLIVVFILTASTTAITSALTVEKTELISSLIIVDLKPE